MLALGYKCNMHDLSAALLLPQLARIEKTSRERLCKAYDKLLEEWIQSKSSRIEEVSTPTICTR